MLKLYLSILAIVALAKVVNALYSSSVYFNTGVTSCPLNSANPIYQLTDMSSNSCSGSTQCTSDVITECISSPVDTSFGNTQTYLKIVFSSDSSCDYTTYPLGAVALLATGSCYATTSGSAFRVSTDGTGMFWLYTWDNDNTCNGMYSAYASSSVANSPSGSLCFPLNQNDIQDAFQFSTAGSALIEIFDGNNNQEFVATTTTSSSSSSSSSTTSSATTTTTDSTTTTTAATTTTTDSTTTTTAATTTTTDSTTTTTAATTTTTDSTTTTTDVTTTTSDTATVTSPATTTSSSSSATATTTTTLHWPGSAENSKPQLAAMAIGAAGVVAGLVL